MIKQYYIILKNYKRGYHLVTSEILSQIDELPNEGLMNLFLKHTSAGLSINENADYSVRVDFETTMNKIVPEGLPSYSHVFEGDDDMPAHLKSSLIGVSLTIPISNGKLNLGTWQGIYLCEFRNHGGNRKIVVTIFS